MTVTLEIPEDAVVVGPNGEKRTFAWIEFLRCEVLSDAKHWGLSPATIFCGIEILRAVEGKKPHDRFGLTHDQYERLKDSTNTPSKGYNPYIMMQAPQFLRAILEPVHTDTN